MAKSICAGPSGFSLQKRLLMNKILLLVLMCVASHLNAQTHLDQNGLKTSVSGSMTANGTQPYGITLLLLGIIHTIGKGEDW
jgi:hypothetical protein